MGSEISTPFLWTNGLLRKRMNLTRCCTRMIWGWTSRRLTRHDYMDALKRTWGSGVKHVKLDRDDVYKFFWWWSSWDWRCKYLARNSYRRDWKYIMLMVLVLTVTSMCRRFCRIIWNWRLWSHYACCLRWVRRVGENRAASTGRHPFQVQASRFVFWESVDQEKFVYFKMMPFYCKPWNRIVRWVWR
jgi:hypothetical protein